ncbi:MAG: SDR family oxidoreductase [Rhodospirillales bacterium]|jgi:nucleoside-diphosphate-sugar epimerase|nr:SDR family oxidoreductase [Rhodospirillales bacterium]MDP6882572.1 SDR family oxidoreductase [Rhodospirillales bacterium]
MTPNRAVVAGATGTAATRLVELLAGDGDWDVVGLCRVPPASGGGVTYLTVDLADADDCRAKLSALSDTTHLFYAARAAHDEDAPEDVAANLAMLRNTVEAIEAAAPTLRHVHLVHGTNYYGVGLGPYKTPAREDDPRRDMPNFYYDQHDYIVERQDGKAWSWSIARPDVIADFRPGRARNMISIIATYAAVRQEMGLAFSFPGTAGNYAALIEITEASILARASKWMATTEACANQAFNVTNGGTFRWCNLWPRMAEFFGMELGPVETVTLAQSMADKGPVWERIVARHGLKPTPYRDMALWEYGDTNFRRPYDMISDTTKCRRFGFHDVIDSEDMFLRLLGGYRAARLTL